MIKKILTKDIYPSSIVKKGISDYKEFAEIKYKNEEITIISKTEASDELTLNEFLNYLIYIKSESNE